MKILLTMEEFRKAKARKIKNPVSSHPPKEKFPLNDR